MRKKNHHFDDSHGRYKLPFTQLFRKSLKGPIFGIHIKDKTLLEALIQYENEYRSSLGEDEYQNYREEIDSKLKK